MSTMFLKLIIPLFSAAVSAIPTGRYDTVFPSLETLRSGLKIIKFRTLDQDIQLRLEPAGHVISDNFAIVNGNKKEYSINVKSLKQKLYRDKEAGAALIIDEEGPLTIKGIVNHNLRIEPYESKRTMKENTIAHRIIEVKPEKSKFFKDGIIPKNMENTLSSQKVKSRKEECITVEYLFVTERTFTAGFKDDKAITDYLAVMMTGIQNLIDTLELGITVRMLGITPFREGNEPDFVDNSGIAGTTALNTDLLVDNMGKYYCKNRKLPFVPEADIIMLITKRSLGDPIPEGGASLNAAGVSYINGVCQTCLKVGISMDDSDYNERVDTVAHESAHLLGSCHDGEGIEYVIEGAPGSRTCSPSEGYIMGDGWGVNKLLFSPCTRKNIEYLLNNYDYTGCVLEECSG